MDFIALLLSFAGYVFYHLTFWWFETLRWVRKGMLDPNQYGLVGLTMSVTTLSFYIFPNNPWWVAVYALTYVVGFVAFLIDQNEGPTVALTTLLVAWSINTILAEAGLIYLYFLLYFLTKGWGWF